MEFPSHLFEGLPGVFSDSLANGWGRMLFDRLIKSKGIHPSSLSPLYHLANARGYQVWVHLFTSQIIASQTKRQFHMHTAGLLLHSDFRTPSLDYEDLINLTGALTKVIREKEKMYRLAVF